MNNSQIFKIVTISTVSANVSQFVSTTGPTTPIVSVISVSNLDTSLTSYSSQTSSSATNQSKTFTSSTIASFLNVSSSTSNRHSILPPSSFASPLRRSSSATPTSTAAVVNIIPSPRPSHSLQVAHSVSSTNSITRASPSLSSATLSTTSTFQTPLKDQPGTDPFTFVTLPSSSQSSIFTPPPTPTLSSSQTSTSASASDTSPSPQPSAKLSHVRAAVIGTFGALCLVFALVLVIWSYKRRRRNYSSMSTSPQSNRHSWPYSSGNDAGASSSGQQMQEVTYSGTRRFRFPQVNVPKRPMTFSPPIAHSNSFDTTLPGFPSDGASGSNTGRQVSTVFLPPSLEQTLGTRFNCVPPPRYVPPRIETAKSVSSPPGKRSSMSSARSISVCSHERPPSLSGNVANTQQPVPQIRLEYVETRTPNTGVGSFPSDSDTTPQQSDLAYCSGTTSPTSGGFLSPPTPVYVPSRSSLRTTRMTSPPPRLPPQSPLTPLAPPDSDVDVVTTTASTSSVSPTMNKFEKEKEKQQDNSTSVTNVGASTKDPAKVCTTATATQEGAIISSNRLTWASTLRMNLLNAVQFMNSIPENDREHCDDETESEVGSLYSKESSSESGKSAAMMSNAATGNNAGAITKAAVQSKVKKAQRRTWVVVNCEGGPRPVSQSVESFSEAYGV